VTVLNCLGRTLLGTHALFEFPPVGARIDAISQRGDGDDGDDAEASAVIHPLPANNPTIALKRQKRLIAAHG
jgi:hypothetical protein